MAFTLLRNFEVTPEEIGHLRKVIQEFLTRAPLEESTLILDGPGLGCARAFLVLPLLGVDRLKRLKAIHSFSASAYAVFWYSALKEGLFRYDLDRLEYWNRENQIRHGAKIPIVSLFKFLGQKALGKKYLFPNDRLEDAMEATVMDAFRFRRVEDLAPNLNFWSFNQTDQEFTRINAHGDLCEITTGQVMRALTAVPHLYEPFRHNGKVYSDALFAPGIRELFRKLREECRNCLFVHMTTSGEKGQTLFLKGHDNGTGAQRVAVDFLYFLAGIKNRDMDTSMRKLFREIEPV